VPALDDLSSATWRTQERPARYDCGAGRATFRPLVTGLGEDRFARESCRTGSVAFLILSAPVSHGPETAGRGCARCCPGAHRGRRCPRETRPTLRRARPVRSCAKSDRICRVHLRFTRERDSVGLAREDLGAGGLRMRPDRVHASVIQLHSSPDRVRSTPSRTHAITVRMHLDRTREHITDTHANLALADAHDARCSVWHALCLPRPRPAEAGSVGPPITSMQDNRAARRPAVVPAHTVERSSSYGREVT